MKRILIGHRGVGKSSLLERHQDYFPEIPVFDLDQVIAEKENQSVSEIFAARGEAAFRELENKYFQELTGFKDYAISVGAGFNTEHLPSDAEVIYVSRRTDSDGRIFLNRPRLNPEVSALEEYKVRYQAREPNYRKACTWVYHLPEGLNGPDQVEKKILSKDFSLEYAYFTLSNASEIELWPNIEKFELRTDVFSLEEIRNIISKYKEKRFIVAVRSKILPDELRGLRVDWALENGPVPAGVNAQIISLHEGDFVQALTLIQQQPAGKHLKFCPVINSFDELILAMHWQNDDRQNRSFLPRTKAGEKSRWRWFRNLMWRKQKINFVQSQKDFDDQPSLYEYILSQNSHREFGAVLGDPIHHSRTPMVQGPNMADYGMILAVPLSEDDFMQGIAALQEFGLKFAAVTSPLKLKAASLIGLEDSEKGINSIIYHHGMWQGTSTDADGFEALIEESEIADLINLNVAIWGGGGVISALKNVLPNAVEYSARTGKPRDANADPNFIPDVVVWAAPRFEGVQIPPSKWNPKYILDVNYVENSMGLEYAQTVSGATYISGLEMFYVQARSQFKFWAKHLIAEG